MRTKVLLIAAVALYAFAGCDHVEQAEFDAWKDQVETKLAGIKEDGDALDEWVAATNAWIMWLNNNQGLWCEGCPGTAPPAPPPQPPPDGDWD